MEEKKRKMNPNSLKNLEKSKVRIVGLSKEEARKNGSKGGKATQRRRKQRMATCELAKFILSLALPEKDDERVAEWNVPEKFRTVDSAGMLSLGRRAIQGDRQAYETLKKMAGEYTDEKRINVMGELDASGTLTIGKSVLEDGDDEEEA